MHFSAYKFGEIFFKTYYKHGMKVVEIGSQNVNGSLKDNLSDINENYVGVDFVEGPGVDVVLDDPYKLPFADESVDILVSSSCFEHSELFWLSYLEMLRILKPTGILYLNVPNNGCVHRYPVDCWRFYPDAGQALETWGNRNGISVQLIESFIGKQIPDDKCHSEQFGRESGRWNDFIAVFIKDRQFIEAYPNRMFKDQEIAYTSLRHEAEEGKLPHVEKLEDFRIQDQYKITQAKFKKDFESKALKLSEASLIIDELKKHLKSEQKKSSLLEKNNEKTTSLLEAEKKKNQLIINSKTWRYSKPLRIFIVKIKSSLCKK